MKPCPKCEKDSVGLSLAPLACIFYCENCGAHPPTASGSTTAAEREWNAWALKSALRKLQQAAGET